MPTEITDPALLAQLEAEPTTLGMSDAKLRSLAAGFVDPVLGVGQLAHAAIDANPDAIGLKGYIPDVILQRADPKGVSTRATLSDLSSTIINARSGAAVSTQELERLKGFLPMETDTPQAAQAKLAQLNARLADRGYAIRGAAPAAPAVLNPKVEATKIINGKSYVKQGGKWYAN